MAEIARNFEVHFLLGYKARMNKLYIYCGKFDTVFGAIAMPSKERNHFLFKKLPSYKTYRLEGAIMNCSVSK